MQIPTTLAAIRDEAQAADLRVAPEFGIDFGIWFVEFTAHNTRFTCSQRMDETDTFEVLCRVGDQALVHNMDAENARAVASSVLSGSFLNRATV